MEEPLTIPRTFEEGLKQRVKSTISSSLKKLSVPVHDYFAIFVSATKNIIIAFHIIETFMA